MPSRGQHAFSSHVHATLLHCKCVRVRVRVRAFECVYVYLSVCALSVGFTQSRFVCPGLLCQSFPNEEKCLCPVLVYEFFL